MINLPLSLENLKKIVLEKFQNSCSFSQKNGKWVADSQFQMLGINYSFPFPIPKIGNMLGFFPFPIPSVEKKAFIPAPHPTICEKGLPFPIPFQIPNVQKPFPLMPGSSVHEMLILFRTFSPHLENNDALKRAFKSFHD